MPRYARIIRPDMAGTAVILAGLIITYSMLDAEIPSEIAKQAAWGVLLSLGCAVLSDFQFGIRNLLRPDIICLASLYFLSLFEFLFPQQEFNQRMNAALTIQGIEVLFLGFAGIAVGRHFFPPDKAASVAFKHQFKEIPIKMLMRLLFLSSFLAYANILLAVNWNPFVMIDAMMGPRFSQPWGRGQFGDWKALFYELSMMIYVIPPLCGVLLARRREIHAGSFLFIFGILSLTLFYGFSSGTRNIFATYVALFAGAFLFSLRKITLGRTAVVGTASLVLLLFATHHMLAFRQIGLKNYIESNSVWLETPDSYFVDYNLAVISALTYVFPNRYDYLGWEVPWWALVKPVPRALWPGKPTGFSVSIEQALEAEGLTIATTFVGEAYMAGGKWAVFVFGCFFGAVASYWNRRWGSRPGSLNTLIYSSGFFAAAITMRSLLWFTTAILPTLAIIVYARYFVKQSGKRRPAPNPPPLAPPAT